jgi:hypothetical protein
MAKFIDTQIDSLSSTTPLHHQTKNKTPTRSILKSSSQTTTSMVSSSLHPHPHVVTSPTVTNTTTTTTNSSHHPDAYYIDRAKQILLDEEKLNEIRKDAIQLSKQPTTANSGGSGGGSHHFFHHRDEFIIGANLTENPHSNTCGSILIGLSWFLMVIFFPFSLFMTLKVVQEYELVYFLN